MMSVSMRTASHWEGGMGLYNLLKCGQRVIVLYLNR